jgi:hypothetical protein
MQVINVDLLGENTSTVYNEECRFVICGAL